MAKATAFLLQLSQFLTAFRFPLLFLRFSLAFLLQSTFIYSDNHQDLLHALILLFPNRGICSLAAAICLEIYKSLNQNLNE